MSTPPSRARSIKLYNLAPIFWPLWLWGATPGAVAAAVGIVAAGYLWNVLVLAGLLVLVGSTQQVGQRGLLSGAAWMTLAGLVADIVHGSTLLGLLARMDFLLNPEPLATLLSAMVLPAAIILVSGLILTLTVWRLEVLDSLLVSVWLAVLSAPWLSLLIPDAGGQVIPVRTIQAILAALAVAVLWPWALLAAGAWASDRGRSVRAARAVAAVAAGVVLGLLGTESLLVAHPDSQVEFMGEICFSIRGRVYVQSGATGQRSLLASDPGRPVAWSPDGSKILMQRTITATDWIQIMNARDGTVARLAAGQVESTAWSPDGLWLLYTTDRPTPQDDLIWRVQPGQRPAQIAQGSGPNWSPDGRRVVYSSRGSGARPQVWVMNPDGSDPIQVTTEGGEDPAWSPDGAHIAYSYNGQVYVMLANGSERRQVTSGEELFERNPVVRWSPDGTRLAYAVFQQSQGMRPSAVYVAALDGRPHVRESGDYQPPLAWSPDGRYLAMVRGEEVWGLDVGRVEWQALTPGSGFAWGGRGPAVSIRPAPTYGPTPTPTPLPPAVVESPDVLAIDPRDGTVLYAGTPQGVVKRTAAGGWAAASQGIAYPRRVRAIAVDPSSPAVLYAGTDGERGIQGGTLYKSVDRGVRWSATSLTGVDIYAIVVDPLNPATVYAGTISGVYKSMDAGATWRGSGAGLRSSAVQALAVDAASGRGGAATVLYAGTRQGDLHKSSDGAATWIPVDSRDTQWTSLAVSPLPSGMVFAAGADGLLRSVDGGVKWEGVAGGIWRLKLDCVAVSPQDPQVIYVSGPSGVYKSSDGGENWGPASVGLGDARSTTLAIDPKDPAILYAGTDKGVFRSSNAAVYWQR